jgi:hypothetical protein
MAIHKLTPRKVAIAQFGKYEDGGGLRLVVSSSGAKKRVFRVHYWCQLACGALHLLWRISV